MKLNKTSLGGSREAFPDTTAGIPRGVLLYDRALSERERLGVDAYLKARYFPDQR